MNIPNCLNTEKSYLSCLLLDSDLLNTCDITSDYFYNPIHRHIFQAMIELKSCDIVIINEKIQDKVDIDYLYELSSFIFHTGEFKNYEAILKNKFFLRKILGDVQKITHDIYKEDIEKVNDQILSLGKNFISSKIESESFNDIFIKIIEEREKGIEYLKSGFNSLDKIIGGFQEGNLTLIAGRPGMGKSIFALMMALNMSHKNKCSFFSFEMSSKEVVKRIMTNKLGNIKNMGTDEIYNGIMDQDTEHLNNIKIYDHGNNLTQLISRIKEDYYNDGIDIVFIDYLQLIEAQAENRVQEVSKISKQLKNLASELKIKIFALSQLSRAIESRINKYPVLSDLRESGSLEQDANITLMLYREDYYDKDTDKKGILTVFVRKNRDGDIGECDLKCDFSRMNIYE